MPGTGFASIRDHDLPSVAWRLHATAAQLHRQMRDFEGSERHSLVASSSRAGPLLRLVNDLLRRYLMGAAENTQGCFQRELEQAK